MTFFFVDLYAGLGGASSAMIDDEEWHIISIDNNEALIEHHPSLLMGNIRDFQATCALIEEALRLANFRSEEDTLIIWSSPPCLEFSTGWGAPKSVAQRAGIPFEPSMEDLEVSMKIIHHFKPQYWFIENVRGACPYFMPYLGKHKAHAGSFFLWGVFPSLSFDDRARKHKKSDVDRRHHPLRSNFRAKVPLSVSRTIKHSIEEQRTFLHNFWTS